MNEDLIVGIAVNQYMRIQIMYFFHLIIRIKFYQLINLCVKLVIYHYLIFYIFRVHSFHSKTLLFSHIIIICRKFKKNKTTTEFSSNNNKINIFQNYFNLLNIFYLIFYRTNLQLNLSLFIITITKRLIKSPLLLNLHRLTNHRINLYLLMLPNFPQFHI